MKRVIRLLSVAALGVLISGCGEQEMIGGGSRGIDAGTTAKASVYGIRAGMEVGFVIFTDLPSSGTKSSSGSNWTGRIEPATGAVVNYEGDAEGLTIEGTRYEFAKGRIFLVTTTGGTVSVQHLNLPIGTGKYDAEIDSLSKLKEVREFLVP